MITQHLKTESLFSLVSLSKWPHFHSAYLVTACKQKATAVCKSKFHYILCKKGYVRAHLICIILPFFKDGPLKWLWINEMTRHDIILSSAFTHLDRLNKCVRGIKVLDDESKNLADHLSKGIVLQSWLGEDKTLDCLKVSNFIRIINERTALYLVRFEST